MQVLRPLTVLTFFVVLTLSGLAAAQTATGIPPEITTPDRVETRIGTLEFRDGGPSVATAEKVYDTLAFTAALNVSNNSFRGAMRFAKASSTSVPRTTRLSSFPTCWTPSRCS